MSMIRNPSLALLKRFLCRYQSTGTRNFNPDGLIYSGVCVQRFPILSRTRNGLEKRVHELKVSNMEKKSRLSDFELEEINFLRQLKAREEKAQEEGIAVSVVDLNMEFEELQESFDKDFASFKPQPRETECDRTGNTHSTRRRLDRILYLLVKNGNDWMMPQGNLIEGNSLCQTARLQLRRLCGSDLSVQFLSNAPFACHSLPINKRAKVFFLKAQYLSGAVSINTDQLEDYAWVTKQELKEYLSPQYYSSISPALLD